MSHLIEDGTMPDRAGTSSDSTNQWESDRTTFQRVYDVLTGTSKPVSAQQFSEWAVCSENGARQALEQLVEMEIAEQTETSPALYRRNPSYFEWKRVERLAREHSSGELRARLEDLLETDQKLQEKYGVLDPGAVVVTDDPAEDYDMLHDRWGDLTEWRTVRQDITMLKRAVRRTETGCHGKNIH